MTEWAHPKAFLQLQWSQDTDKSDRVEEPFARIIAGEGDFQGKLARFGHGLQRSYLLALLPELSGTDDPTGPRLILGCEEPELYQHPPQARHLAAVLQKLSRGNSQVIVSTHHPVFVSGEGFENVRMVRHDAPKSARTSPSCAMRMSRNTLPPRPESRQGTPRVCWRRFIKCLLNLLVLRAAG